MHLVDCFVEVFSFVRVQLNDENAGMSEPSFREKIDELFASKVHMALESGYQASHYDDAKFAVVAWIDEQILSSNLAFKESWRSRLLQTHYFNSVKGGQQFFEKLNLLDQFDAFDMDVREVFFYCLAFGFHGKYYTDAGLTELAAIRKSNLQLLSQNQGKDFTSNWFSQLPVEGGEQNVQSKPAGWAVMFGLPLLAVVVVTAWMRVDLLHTLENLIKSF